MWVGREEREESRLKKYFQTEILVRRESHPSSYHLHINRKLFSYLTPSFEALSPNVHSKRVTVKASKWPPLKKWNLKNTPIIKWEVSWGAAVCLLHISIFLQSPDINPNKNKCPQYQRISSAFSLKYEAIDVIIRRDARCISSGLGTSKINTLLIFWISADFLCRMKMLSD